MRIIGFVLLMMMPLMSVASEVICYSNGRMIYSSEGKDIAFEDGLFVFKEAKSGKIVFIAADCIIKV